MVHLCVGYSSYFLDGALNILFQFKSALGYVWIVNSFGCVLLTLLFWLVLSTLWLKRGTSYVCGDVV